ncbi:MAG: response regulator [Candidatus Desulfofervidaceae bacterium]|nr:response regulator [Candidatus Desulfofervidaceae bacterium]
MQQPHNILVVDDEENVLNAIKRIFKPYTLITCFTTTDPFEALKIVDKEKIDLIITDQRMPGMTGIELLKKITAKYPEVIKIILSAYSDLNVILEAINEVGVYKFILKPWNNEDFLLTVIRALEWKELIGENRSLQEEIKKRDAILAYWEQRYPGITKVKTDENGEVYIELDEDLGELLK